MMPPTSGRRPPGRGRFFALAGPIALGLAAAACSDDGIVEPTPVESAVGKAIQCQASLEPAEVTCLPQRSAPTTEPSDGSDILLGGHDHLVRVEATDATHDADGGVLRAQVNVENRLDRLLGTVDGFEVTGVEVFHLSDPVVTSGGGDVRLRNSDGTDVLLEGARPYFRYDEILGPGETSSKRTWEWSVDPATGSFHFELLVRADVRSSPEPPTTGFENRQGETWTAHQEELEFLAAVAEGSPRVALTEIGQSIEGRPIHLLRLGYPEPPPDESIAEGRSVLFIGAQHGNEPAGREAALELLRDLAFTRDSELLKYLEETTLLFIPTASPDGREDDSRTNAMGIDTNRDHTRFLTPEGQAMARVLRDFTPHVVVDAHERPGASSPDMQVLWPRNLNVHEPVREESRRLVEDYILGALGRAGFGGGLYAPSPGPPGDENETILRNTAGLRHSVSLLTESSGQQEKAHRTEVQRVTFDAVVDFHRTRSDEVAAAVTEGPEAALDAAAESEPVFLFGADNAPPDPEDVLDPAPCGYVINVQQAETLEPQERLFPLQLEAASDSSYFVPAGQPMGRLAPLLLDERARANVVDGVPVVDPETCGDPGSVPPPSPPPPSEEAQFEANFSLHEPGASPAGWSESWRASQWTVLEGPGRVRHEVDDDGGRRALVWDEVGDNGHVQGDVEIFGLVRVKEPMPTTRFQMAVHVSGETERENAFYVDGRGSSTLRINRYRDGSFSSLATGSLPFTIEPDTWYRVVLRREGTYLRAKMWPDGTEEPAEWQVVTASTLHDGGQVGVSHFAAGAVNSWAYIGVGTGGLPAPRAPEDLVASPD